MMYGLIPVVASCLLLAAHFLRAGNLGLVALWLSAPLLLLSSRRWVAIVFQLLLLIGSGIWLSVLVHFWKIRAFYGQPRLRLVLILGSVALFTAVSALFFFRPALKKRYSGKDQSTWGAVAAFILTALTLTIVQFRVPFPAILLERFLPGGGFWEGFWLAAYAGGLVQLTANPRRAKKWRPWIWWLFSFVFFIQLLAGLSGFERFLMTGKLHLPVPALILAGPLYRGEGFFMLILFGITILLVGPAWCSWLCYIGAWDDLACRQQKTPRPLPGWCRYLHLGLLAGIVITAYVLRIGNLPVQFAVYLAAAFGLVGVGLMILWSARRGTMTHCTAYCPIGIISTFLGKLSPFRLRIKEQCDECGVCLTACRYDSLRAENIRLKQVGSACTLCGECVAHCQKGNIVYQYFKLTPAQARSLFRVLIVSLHAVFLGVARI